MTRIAGLAACFPRRFRPAAAIAAAFIAALLEGAACVLSAAAAGVEVPRIQLGVGKMGGHLGIGKEARSIEIQLSNRDRSRRPSNESLAAGDLYYFLCSSGTAWKLEREFVEKKLPSITITQGDQTTKPESVGEIILEDGATTVLLGFPKSLRLRSPLIFRFPVEEGQSNAEMLIPEALWDGYPERNALYQKGRAALDGSDPRTAISLFSQLLASPGSLDYSFYKPAQQGRTDAFATIFNGARGKCVQAASDSTLSYRHRIAQMEEGLAVFHGIADSLPNPALGAGEDVPAVAELLAALRTATAQAEAAIAQYRGLREEEDTRWIIEGRMAGPSGYKYAPMVDALAHAFLSLPFDEPIESLRPRLDAERRKSLKRDALEESLESFMELCQRRRASGEPLFPPGFLEKVRENAPLLAQPYAEIFGAVAAFLAGRGPECLSSVQSGLRMTSDDELSLRLDFLGTMIRERERPGATEARALIVEARRLEDAGRLDEALERYKRATASAPEHGPAAFALGQFYDRQGDAYRAHSYYLTAYERDPSSFSACQVLAANYIKQGSYAQAIELLAGALGRGMDCYEIRFKLGQAHAASGQHAEAIEHYQKALALNAKSYDTLIQLGSAYQSAQKYDKAREHYTRAIQLDPDAETAIDCLRRLDELLKRP